MVRSTVLVALVLMVVIESTLVDSWWWRRSRRRRRKTNCAYPKPSQGDFGKSSDYFYGDTSLAIFEELRKRSIVWNTCALLHSLLLFRGTIFEWGIHDGNAKSYDLSRTLYDCKISWSGRKGESRCRLSDAKTWTRAYKRRYGKYGLFFNNCHIFVNRLGAYLATNCGR